MGGFEGADHVNAGGHVLDMSEASGHLMHLEEDHRRAAHAGLSCVRESIGWRLSESPGGAINLDRALRIARSAKRHGLQVLWTLMHYGVPDDLDLHSDALITRFGRFAGHVARVLADVGDCTPIYTPINEIGFLAWGASQPNVFRAPNNTPATDHEATRGVGWAVKRRLVAAELAAIEAIRRVDPSARFLHVEPLVHIAAPHQRPDLTEVAEAVASWQWQAWDMLCGKAQPELGGYPEALDILGVNHYDSSQWEFETGQCLHWHGRDTRRRPLAGLLDDVWKRYGRPLLISETGHVGAGREGWLHQIGSQVRAAQLAGVPALGVCLYPLVDRPDWNDPGYWHRSGLWHVGSALDPAPNSPHATLRRSAETDYLAALETWQRELPAVSIDRSLGRPVLLVFSHLRWCFVRHRSHHLLSRLAQRWRVVFVEEPLFAHGPPRLDHACEGPHLDTLTPRTDVTSGGGFAAAQRALVLDLLRDWLTREGISAPIAWLCTPLALPLAEALEPRFLVYDCADELSGFWGASDELAGLEADLLARADLVFAAGPSLAEARRAQAGNRLHLAPNGVDAARFSGASLSPDDWEAGEAALLDPAPGAPCLGYVGVIDERMDLALFEHLVDARPNWQFVMVGPVVKIDPASLPQRPNVHWLGDQPWRLLPHLMAKWKVGLLPFAINAATRHAYPLKVLEYLAAGLPVVASPVPDLFSLQGCGVSIAHDNASFVRACDEAMHASAPEIGAVSQGNREAHELTSWDSVVAAMDIQLMNLLR